MLCQALELCHGVFEIEGGAIPSLPSPEDSQFKVESLLHEPLVKLTTFGVKIVGSRVLLMPTFLERPFDCLILHTHSRNLSSPQTASLSQAGLNLRCTFDIFERFRRLREYCLVVQLVAEGSLQSESMLEAIKWEIRAMAKTLTQNEKLLESLRNADNAEASNERQLRHNLQEDARQALGGR